MSPQPQGCALTTAISGRFSRQRGFSLLELAIATLLGTLAIGISLGLLTESQQVSTRLRSQLTDPAREPLLLRVRTDIRQAQRVLSYSPTWTTLDLELQHIDRRVSYRRIGSEIFRIVESNGQRSEQPVGKGLAQWQWRNVSPNLVEIEIGHHSDTGAGYGLLDRGARTLKVAHRRHRWWLRGNGRVGGW